MVVGFVVGPELVVGFGDGVDGLVEVVTGFEVGVGAPFAVASGVAGVEVWDDGTEDDVVGVPDDVAGRASFEASSRVLFC